MLHKWIILSQDYFLKTVDLSLRGKKYGMVVALLNLAHCVLQVYKWLLYNVQNFITTDWKFWWCIKTGFSSCWLQKKILILLQISLVLLTMNLNLGANAMISQSLLIKMMGIPKILNINVHTICNVVNSWLWTSFWQLTDYCIMLLFQHLQQWS